MLIKQYLDSGLTRDVLLNFVLIIMYYFPWYYFFLTFTLHLLAILCLLSLFLALIHAVMLIKCPRQQQSYQVLNAYTFFFFWMLYYQQIACTRVTSILHQKNILHASQYNRNYKKREKRKREKNKRNRGYISIHC